MYRTRAVDIEQSVLYLSYFVPILYILLTVSLVMNTKKRERKKRREKTKKEYWFSRLINN